MKKASTTKADQDIPELKREQLGVGVRGKYLRQLANFEAERDVWQEVLDGVREIKAGGGKRTSAKAPEDPSDLP